MDEILIDRGQFYSKSRVKGFNDFFVSLHLDKLELKVGLMFGKNEASDHALRQTRDNTSAMAIANSRHTRNQGKVRTVRTLREVQPASVLGGNDKNHTLFLR